MARRVDQLLPAAHAGDATGDSALHLSNALTEAGYDAGLYALTIDPELRGRVRPFDDFPPPREGDLTLLHFALPSVLSEALLGYAGMRGIVYHNLTPPEMLASFAPEIARLTARGREELELLADSERIDLAIGVSRFNTADLEATGFAHTATLPLPVDLARYDVPSEPVLEERLAAAPRIFLSVGRVAPNKRLEDLLRAAAYYLRYVDPAAWFVMVGGNRGLERYYDALMHLVEEIGLDDRVRFTGRVSHRELVTWYRAADAYVCTSEHEGFCAPLLEAMHFELPILARHAAAVPETLGDAGVTFADAVPAQIAESLHLLATDTALRGELARRARARLDFFLPSAVVGRWVATIRDRIGEPLMTPSAATMKLTLVVQRYGPEVVGGAERLARGVAEGLAARGHDVEVLTSCARSYRTWSNHYPEGTERIADVAVRRFRTVREREMESFNELSERVFGGGRRSIEQELEWIEAQGPHSPALVDHLHAVAADRDRLLFFTYLYHPTVHGLHAAPRKSVLVPTAHDEAPIYLESYRSVFTLPAGLVFNTRAEAEFVHRRFPEADQPSIVAGVGIDGLEELARAGREAHQRPPTERPVVLYAGRIDEGKGVGELIRWLARFREETTIDLSLQLMGEAAMEIPDEKWIEPLGFVSDEEKRRRLAEATLLAAPSALESFGIVLLEANAAGTPALANGASDAYVEHCTLGGGGLWYGAYDEFREALGLLLVDAALRTGLAHQGASYVRDRFGWATVVRRYEEFLAGV